MKLRPPGRRTAKTATVNTPRGVPSRPVSVLPRTPTRIFDILAYQLACYPKPDAFACKVEGAWRKYSSTPR